MSENGNTAERILRVARQVLADAGPAALTFEAVARRLGVTKQAVIYWFPTKQDLMREIVVPLLRAEADALAAAVEGATGAADAVARAVRAVAAFHLADLGRFRLMYLSVQVDRRPDLLLTTDTLQAHVHPTTARLYGALAEALDAGGDLRADIPPRRAAATVHMATLGLLTMVALGDAIDDPLAHGIDDLTETLIALLATGVGAQSSL
ncbi:MAG: helix-turn-helix domain-containing protein [Alphaproteobacteria bacterium]